MVIKLSPLTGSVLRAHFSVDSKNALQIVHVLKFTQTILWNNSINMYVVFICSCFWKKVFAEDSNQMNPCSVVCWITVEGLLIEVPGQVRPVLQFPAMGEHVKRCIQVAFHPSMERWLVNVVTHVTYGQ